MSKYPARVSFDAEAIRDKIDADHIQVRSFDGSEQISHLFEGRVHLVCIAEGGITDEEAKRLVSEPCWVAFTREVRDESGSGRNAVQVVTEHKMAGMICSIQSRQERHHSEYFLRFVPRLWLTTLSTTSEVFLGKRPDDIITKKLKDANLEDDWFRFQLSTSFENVWKAVEDKDRYIVQYEESDYDFICRLCEHWGIFFFFEHDEEKGDVVVFSDTPDAYRAADAPRTTRVVDRGDRVGVYALESRRTVIPKQYAVRDYNHRHPHLDVQADKVVDAAPGAMGRVYEFGPHVKNREAAKYFAQVRTQEAAVRGFEFVGEADCPWFSAGLHVRFEADTFFERGQRDFLLTEVYHHTVQPVFGMAGDESEEAYRTEFHAIPIETPFRPPLLTPKPKVNGLLVGVINDLSQGELGAIDDDGKYDVAFMFDEAPIERGKRKSRPIRMAQPSAGDRRGLHLPLRDGVEVVVGCVNGDPDRPIILGAVPNPRMPDDVTAKNRETSALVTNRTALYIDDQDPRWRIMVGDEEGDEKTVLQLGQPSPQQTAAAQKSWNQGVFEKGAAITTVHNMTTTANKAVTSVCSTSNSYQKWRASVTVGDRIDWTGDANPMSKWDGIAEIATNLETLAKGLGGAFEYGRTLMNKRLTADEERAERAADEAVKIVAQTLGYPDEAPKKQNPDGTATPTESESEFVERRLEEQAQSGEQLPHHVQGALHAMRQLQQASNDATAAREAADRDPDAEAVKATADEIASVAESVSASVAVGKQVKTLYSTISKLFSVAKHKEKQSLANKLVDWTLKTTSATDGRVAPIFTKFAGFSPLMGPAPTTLLDKKEPYTIIGSNHSVGVIGLMNTLLFGKEQLLASSEGDVTVLGNKAVHVKSPNCVEAASHKVKLTSERLVDVHSNGKVSIVAHSGAEDAADKAPDAVHVAQALDHAPTTLADDVGMWTTMAPDDVSTLVHSQKGIKMTSTDENIQATAKRNLMLEAQTENMLTDVHVGSQITNVNTDIVTTSKIGNITTQAATGKYTLLTNAGTDLVTSANTTITSQGLCIIKAEKILLK